MEFEFSFKLIGVYINTITLIQIIDSMNFCTIIQIPFYSMATNILTSSDTQASEFRNCKIRYLIAQNKLLTIQSDAIAKMIKIYKQIIDITTTDTVDTTSQPNQSLVDTLLEQCKHIVKKCLSECQSISQDADIFSQTDQLYITPQFFAQMVLSYEKTIAQLKQEIHHRENILQELQINKNHHLKRKYNQIESVGIVRAVQSYDIYSKLAERCRKEIIELRMKKKQIQENTMDNFYGRHCTQKTQGCEQRSSDDKTVQRINSRERMNMNNNDNLTTFQKVVLIYKKKKLFNQILEKKVINLKKKIKEKQAFNQLLKDKIENCEWENFNKMQATNRNFHEDNPAYLSVLNESMKANNMDFSVDLSKILPTNNKYDDHKHDNTHQQQDKENKVLCDLSKILDD